MVGAVRLYEVRVHIAFAGRVGEEIHPKRRTRVRRNESDKILVCCALSYSAMT